MNLKAVNWKFVFHSAYAICRFLFVLFGLFQCALLMYLTILLLGA